MKMKSKKQKKTKRRKILKKRSYWSYMWRFLFMFLPVLVIIMSKNVSQLKSIHNDSFPSIANYTELITPPASGLLLSGYCDNMIRCPQLFNDMLEGKDEKAYIFDEKRIQTLKILLRLFSDDAEHCHHPNTACAIAIDEWKYDEINKEYNLENILFLTSEEENLILFHENGELKFANCLTGFPEKWKEIVNQETIYPFTKYIEYTIEIDDIYVKDNICRIGKYRLKSSEDDKYTVIEEHDDTPENAEEYRHFINTSKESLNTSDFSWLYSGTSPDSSNLKILKDLKNGDEPIGYKLNSIAYDCEFSDLIYDQPNDFYDKIYEKYSGSFKMPEVECQPTESSNWNGHKYEITYLGISDKTDILKDADFFIIHILLPVMIDWMLLFTIASAILSGHFHRRHSRLYQNQQEAEYRRTLTNTLAHDLKSPLTAAQGYADNLLENTNPEKNSYYIKRIIENIQYTNQIIKDILDLAKIEENDEEPACEKLDVSMIFRQVLESCDEDLKMRGISLNICTKPLIMNVNEAMFRQITANLTDNIVRYTTDNGSVYLGTDKDSIILKNTCSTNSEQNGNELVKPFVKGNKSRSERTGSGIGLSIVQQLAEKQHIKFSVSVQNGFFTVKIG